MEDSVPNSVWAVRVLGHAVRTHKLPSLFPAMDVRDLERISGYLLCGLSERYPGVLPNTGRTQTPRTNYPDMSSRHRTYTEGVKMRIPYHGNRVPGICDITKRPAHGLRENPTNQGMEGTHQRQGDPKLLRICQLLQTLYQGLQQNYHSAHIVNK